MYMKEPYKEQLCSERFPNKLAGKVISLVKFYSIRGQGEVSYMGEGFLLKKYM